MDFPLIWDLISYLRKILKNFYYLFHLTIKLGIYLYLLFALKNIFVIVI